MREGREQINLLGLDRAGLEGFFTGMGEKPFRAHQVMKWIYHHHLDDFSHMTNLGKALRTRLAECARIDPPRIVSEQISSDGTVKWLLALPGGNNAVETVFIPEPGRGTLCISSQAGCMLNCTFCSTATQGFSRNLTTAEIVGQVWLAARRLAAGGDEAVGGASGPDEDGVIPGRGRRPLPQEPRRITNVVFMGMGEPLLNLDAVEPALSVLRDDLAFMLAAKRVTVSTAGVIPGIDRLSEGVDVALAVSLHAPEDALRERLVPLNRKYPIADLMAACRRFLGGRKRHSITFEYTLIDGMNDQPEHARRLVSLLAPIPSKLNLIPFNPFPGTVYRPSPMERIEAFQDIARKGGLVAPIRRTRGDDIAAACGQLVGEIRDKTRRQAGYQRALAERKAAA